MEKDDLFRMSQIKVLDVGCGNKIRGDVGIDRYITVEERKKLQLDKNQIKLESPHPPIIKADAVCLPFQNETFEKVISFHSLEHILNPYMALMEIYRVLKTDGILILDLPNADLYSKSDNPNHYYSWGENELKNLLKVIKFKIIAITTPKDKINMQIVVKK